MIKFVVSNHSDHDARIFVEQRNICERESNSLEDYGILIKAGAQDVNFYSSNENILCPETSGTWRCTVTYVDIPSGQGFFRSEATQLHARFQVYHQVKINPILTFWGKTSQPIGHVFIDIKDDKKTLEITGQVNQVKYGES